MTQNVNGVIKKATCVVYVTTPVGEITINPSSLTVDRGSSDTVQLIFNPSAPIIKYYGHHLIQMLQQ